MTQTLTKNVVALAFIATIFGIFLALPQTSEAKVNFSDIRMSMKDRAMASSTATTTRPVFKDLSCVQEAVLDRETAIATNWTKFNAAMVAALTKRTESLVAAWKMTDAQERATALKTLWVDWKTASKKAHDGLKSDRRATWEAFKQTMKSECKAERLPKEDAEPKEAKGAVTL